MKKLIYCAVGFSLLTLGSSLKGYSQSVDNQLIAMFWNVENFYDYFNGGTSSSDAEFSSYGTRHWSKKKFYRKCEAVSKSIMWVADQYGGLPDVIGFAEVENSFVLRSLINNTGLRKCGYKYVHYDSPDRRGIDVALIYRDKKFVCTSSKPCHIYEENGGVMATRDILVVELTSREDGETTYFLVNHHPSKFGGEVASRPRRAAAMGRLKFLCDSLTNSHNLCDSLCAPVSLSPRHPVSLIAMGDFNDTPDNPLFGIFGESMVNMSVALAKKGEGTIRYEGKWDLIDMFIVDPQTAENSRMEVVKIPFLMTRDKTHIGDKPLRTFVGPRYNGGVSDHCPVILLKNGGENGKN